MRKYISILLVLVLCLSLYACGENDSPATITDLNGKEVQLTAKELCELSQENSVKFFELYGGASITAVGTVKEVNREYEEPDYTAHIVMDEGWELVVMVKDHDEVADLSKGDKIQFSSKIQGCSDNQIFLSHRYYDIDGLRDASKIEIIK